ncbi:MAG: TolC family protein, partial [Spirochaetaceae bacterium]|nr:TolC family protein [Spirochaetaceae bacterium]
MIPRFDGARKRNQAAPRRGTELPGLALLACFFLIFPSLASGQDQPAPDQDRPPPEIRVISPDEAVELAIKNNLGLESSRIGTETRKRAMDMSWNQFIPSISLGGNLSRDNKASTTTVSVMPPITVENPQWHIAGSVQASLTLNAAMFEAMRTLRLSYEGGLIGYEKARIQLERDVRKAYYQVLLLRENIALLQESYAAAQRQVTMAQANYRAGLVPELNVLQARVAMENLRPAIDQAENGLKMSMASFANYLGLPYDTAFEFIPVETETAFIPLDTAELISKAASGRPDILELKHQILTLESTRKAKLLSLTPSVTVGWNSNSVFIRDPFKDSLGNNDDWQQTGAFTLSLGIQLHSLIPFSPNFQAIKDIDDNLRSAHIGLAQAIRGTELEIYNTVLTLEQARITVETQRLTAELAERTYRLTEEAYRAGLRELLEVQNTELELRKARIGMLEQNFNYLKGLIDLEYAMGV